MINLYDCTFDIFNSTLETITFSTLNWDLMKKRKTIKEGVDI